MICTGRDPNQHRRARVRHNIKPRSSPPASTCLGCGSCFIAGRRLRCVRVRRKDVMMPSVEDINFQVATPLHSVLAPGQWRLLRRWRSQPHPPCCLWAAMPAGLGDGASPRERWRPPIQSMPQTSSNSPAWLPCDREMKAGRYGPSAHSPTAEVPTPQGFEKVQSTCRSSLQWHSAALEFGDRARHNGMEPIM